MTTNKPAPGVVVVPSGFSTTVQPCWWITTWWTLAEERGLAGVFFSEHHFTPFNLSPSPNLLIAAVAPAEIRDRYESGVAVLDAAMASPYLTRQDQFARLDQVPIRPRPRQQPRPPVWMTSPSTRRRRAPPAAGTVLCSQQLE